MDRLPLKGGYFEQAAGLLKQLHIVEKATEIDANRVGGNILEYLLRPLRSDAHDLIEKKTDVGDDVRRAGLLSTAPIFHLPSEQVFYGFPVVYPIRFAYIYLRAKWRCCWDERALAVGPGVYRRRGSVWSWG